ncbi:MAG: hypothetical protein OXP66_12400 [Candidatus Tectomicrobia bacterium]|nr:hypothetical protein [Candidatus Tectomicrobia bacterium]
MEESGYDAVAAVLPEVNRQGRYFWESFAERMQDRLGGLPATDGNGLFVDECLRAGAAAVPIAEQNTLWERDAPDSSSKRLRSIYELRIKLGLFYAASLRCLVHGVSRLQVSCGDAEWEAVSEEGQSFSAFAAGQEGEVEVSWTGAAADFGKACLASQVFLAPKEALMLTRRLAEEVYNNVSPGPSGLFALMLAAEGQGENEAVDVAEVFLHALGEAVAKKAVKVNSKTGGDLFITPEFWFLTAPRGIDSMIEVIGARRGAGRFQFSRHQVYDALRAGGYLVGFAARDNTALCGVKSRRWRKGIELRGLCISAGVLFSVRNAPLFEGTVNLMEV